MSRPTIVCWQPLLTDHMLWTLRALGAAADGRLQFRVTRHENATRKAQGWAQVDLEPEALPLVTWRNWLRTVREAFASRADTIHLFGSPFESPLMIGTMLLALVLAKRVYLVSEPYSVVASGYLDDKTPFLNRLKAVLRPPLYRLYGALIRRRVAGVFAISPLAVAQYAAMGVPRARIFPFGYFVPASDVAKSSENRPPDDGALRLAFVGSLIERKGVRDLIDAVRAARRDGASVSLDVFGPGSPAEFDFDGETVRHRGLIPFGQTQDVVGAYDLVVVPSRYDGWGVVTNESLLAGVPVLVSDRAGSAAIVATWKCGALFEAGNVAALAGAIKDLARDRSRLVAMRAPVHEIAALLLPEVAARYMLDSMTKKDGRALPCPWYDCG